jgi:hypothetical protein
MNLLLETYRSARAQYKRLRRRAVFAQIYNANLWGGAESRSGTGSGLATTEKIRVGLRDTIQRFAIRTMVDAPCGDFHWLSKLDLPQYLDRYVGLDIVPQLIKQNERRWAANGISFELADLTRQVPPRADLILCRHLLIHLPFDDCFRVLRNFKRSGSRYLMITNQQQVRQNEEIIFTGSFRPINLCLPPFHLPEPIWSVDDSQGSNDRSVAALFELQTLNLGGD